jgi:site-specific DNA recombinase
MNESSRRRRRFIEYSRVSKVGERGDDLVSPDIQVRDMDAYAKREGIQVVDRITDLDQTGRSFEKRSVKQIITRIEAGEVDGVLLWKWSRWGRNLLQSKIYIAAVEQVGGDVRAATEDFDPQTTMGKFTRDQMLLIAELQSNQISDGWKAVQARRIALGMPPGGAPPIGYKKNGRGKPFVPDPETAPIVRDMFADYLRGLGPMSIAKGLNDRGLTTPRGYAYNVGQVLRMLENPLYAGKLSVHDPECRCPANDKGRRTCGRRIIVQGNHEPLVDDATWEAVRRERESRRQTLPVKTRHPRWFLGGGLAVCGRCGSRLIVNSYTAAKSQAMCSRYRAGRTCEGVWINRVRLESIVGLWLGGQVEEWATQAEAMRDIDEERAQLAKTIDAVRAEEEKIREGLRALQRLVVSGDMTDDDYRDRKREADGEIAGLGNQLRDLQAQLDALDPSGDVYDRLAAALPGDMPSEEWNALLKRIIKRVVVDKAIITIEPRIGTPYELARESVAPRRPKREHETNRDPKTGQFTSS